MITQRRQYGYLAIIVLFAASGASGLMLEVVWSRMLGWLLGATTWSVMTVLIAFMGGLGLGGILWGRLAGRYERPLRLFGLMEISIGLYSLAVPFLFDGLGGFSWCVRESLASRRRPGWPCGSHGGARSGTANALDGRNSSGLDPIRRGGAVAARTNGRGPLRSQHGRRGRGLLRHRLLLDFMAGGGRDERRRGSRRSRLSAWSHWRGIAGP